MVTVRQTKNETLIQKLNKRIFPSDPLALKNTQIYWLVKDGEMPQGFACLHPLKYEPDNVFFSRAGLLPKARGKGLHRKLIDVRLKYCRAHGYKSAITYTLDDNLGSANNLINAGFKLYDPAQRWADSLHKKEVFYFYINF